MSKAMDTELLSFLVLACLRHIKLHKVMIITSIVELATYKDVIHITIMPQKSGKENRAIESHF